LLWHNYANFFITWKILWSNFFMCWKQVIQEVICYDLQIYYGWNYGIAINYKIFDEGLSHVKVEA
jgi:hypothetical protein